MVRRCASANSLTGDIVTVFPRPDGRSGCVHTATTSWRSSRHRRIDATAASGVPIKTMRMSRGFAALQCGKALPYRVEKKKRKEATPPKFEGVASMNILRLAERQ